jgi:hypothetical protein
MTIDKLMTLAAIFFALTLISSWIGDDDTAYKFWGRKPTGAEGIARIRFVLVKFFASLYGGVLVAFLLASYVRDAFSMTMPNEYFVCFMALCMALFALFIGVMQNGIRLIRGRKLRPIYDLALLRYNLDKWKKWPSGSDK